MTKLNIVFDGIFENADIIAVPDEIADKIEQLGQEFLEWVTETSDSDYQMIVDGKVCVVAETDGFIKWLNSCYCPESEKVYVIARNTNYCPEYKTIEF